MKRFLGLLTVAVAICSPFSVAHADPPSEVIGTFAPHSSGMTLATKDFTVDLPQELQSQEVQCKSSTISIDDKAKFELQVHYDQLVNHPQFFRRAEVSLASPVPGVTVTTVFGNPINRGTVSEPIMTVPFNVQWSGDGWLRGEQWSLYPDGRLEKTL